MEEIEQEPKSVVDDKTDQQIRLEEAKAERLKAETKKAKQKARDAARQERKKVFGKVPMKVKIIGLIVIIVLAVIVCGFVIPYVFDDKETHYTSESTLKEAVEIDNLSAIDYVYRGIAEKPGKFLWMDNVEYRVRYEAHVRAYYKMSDIQFKMDNERKIVTAYLPQAEIGSPVLDETKFGYLPANANADMPEILKLCREDAANELNTEQVQKEAYESLQSIVEALTLPLLDSDWQIEFLSLDQYEGGDSDHEE